MPRIPHYVQPKRSLLCLPTCAKMVLATFLGRCMKKYNVESDAMTPIINVIMPSQDAMQQYYDGMKEDLKSKLDVYPSVKAIDRHRSKLGKQTTTWVGGSEYKRFYVWVGKNWRVLVHNDLGVSFEVKEDLTVDEAMTCWHEYRSLLQS